MTEMTRDLSDTDPLRSLSDDFVEALPPQPEHVDPELDDDRSAEPEPFNHRQEIIKNELIAQGYDPERSAERAKRLDW